MLGTTSSRFFGQRFSLELCLPKTLATVKEALKVGHHDEGKLVYRIA